MYGLFPVRNIRLLLFSKLLIMVYGYLYKLLSTASTRYLVFPLSLLLGLIGYKIEGIISDRYTPTLKSIKEKREERLLEEEKEVDSIKEHKFVPKTIFEKNLSPSLKEPDPRLKKYSNAS